MTALPQGFWRQATVSTVRPAMHKYTPLARTIFRIVGSSSPEWNTAGDRAVDSPPSLQLAYAGSWLTQRRVLLTGTICPAGSRPRPPG